MSTKIFIYKSDLEFYTETPTTVNASLLTGVTQGNVSKTIVGDLKTAGGFVFVRVPSGLRQEDVSPLVKEYFETRNLSVSQFVTNKLGY